jgi:hypothetical protein
MMRPVSPLRVKAFGYALLHAHRLQRHGPRVEFKLGPSLYFLAQRASAC